ncbi:MAG TPA: tetratricopeptide repeat protein [Sphingobium sp.]|nr:tetratricopeptide repeat protein [Sphingobium sp.]
MILALLLATAQVSEAPAATRSLYLQLIHQARADGRPRAALAYLNDFDRRYPGDADARALRINSLLDLGDVDRAEAAAANLSDSVIRGHLLAARERWVEAAACYARAIEASPADPLLRNAHGYALLRAGQADQAIEALRAALDLAPADRTIRNNLLLALSVAGRRTDVEAMLRRIPEQDSLRRQLAAEANHLQKGR